MKHMYDHHYSGALILVSIDHIIVMSTPGLSPGFLAIMWKWPSSTPVPRLLTTCGKSEQNKTSSALILYDL